jgi:hypothetical protein
MGSKTLRRLLAGVGIAAVFTAGVGAAAISQDGSGNQPVPDGRSSRVGAASPVESRYVPIVPCRLFSSVTAGPGKFTPGQTRSINKGGDLASQGGKAGGCGIPNGATALEVNITAPLAEGNGYIRVWPDESVEQGSTFMNFTNVFNVSNAGTVDVDKGAVDVMDLKVYNARTHVIIDVLGYYVDDLLAVVNTNGSLARGTTGTSSSKLSAGVYEVLFERDITGCAYTASVGLSTSSGSEADGTVTVVGRAGTPNGLYIRTFATNGDNVDRPFHVTVDC